MQTNDIPLNEVTSSQLHAIGFDSATNRLAIQFKSKAGPGSIYHYANFTAEQFAKFRAAESLGSHFKQHIKPAVDAHPFVKVAPVPVEAAG